MEKKKSRKTLAEEKSKTRRQRFKYIGNKFNKIKECLKKIKKIIKYRNEKAIFKEIIIFENEMVMIEKKKHKNSEKL